MCSRFFLSMYQGFFIKAFQGGTSTPRALKIMASHEGTTQECPLSSIRSRHSVERLQTTYPKLVCQQLCIPRSLRHIQNWFDRLLVDGPSYGYFTEPAKSIRVVKAQTIEEARLLLADLQVDLCWQAASEEGVLVTRKVDNILYTARWKDGLKL